MDNKTKKIIGISLGSLATLWIGAIAYLQAKEYFDRRGKKVIKEGSFTIIIDEEANK